MDYDIQKYLWHDQGRSALASWQLTLSDNEANAFLASIAVLLNYTQTQVWSLVRDGVRALTRPIQLPDANEPGSLTKLTQWEAVTDLMCAATSSKSHRVRNKPMTSVSTLIGVVAILNIVAFYLASGSIAMDPDRQPRNTYRTVQSLGGM